MFRQITTAIALWSILTFPATAQAPGSISGPVAPSSKQLNFTPQRIFNVADYGANATGLVDAQAALNAAATACGTYGGGQIGFNNGRYLVDTVGLTIPTRCVAYCPVPLYGNTNPSPYQSIGYSVILNSAVTITMRRNAGWQGCPVLQKSAVASSLYVNYPNLTQRDTLNIIAAFAGTAFTITAANDTQIRDTFIGGFALGINAVTSGTARAQWDHVNIDATKCLLLDNSHDISRLTHVQCFPFMSSGYVNAQTTLGISNIANNGSGLYRITLASPSTIPVTGDTIWIDQTVVGPQSIQARRWPITAISSTQFDLQGSAGTGSVSLTGNTNNLTKTVTNLSSTANLGVGQTCTGTGIPGSTTIAWLSPNGNDMGLSNAVTATNTGVSITCTDTAYSSGGTANYDAAFRADIGMEFTNSEGDVGLDLFSFGHSTGFHLGTGMAWFSCTSCFTDGPIFSDITVTSLLIDGNSKGNSWLGGRLNGNAIRINSSSGFAAANIVGVDMNSTGNNWVPVIEVDRGTVTINGNSSTNGASTYLFKDGITNVTLVGNTFTGSLQFETSVGQAKVQAGLNTLPTTSSLGTASFKNQQVILGLASGCSNNSVVPCNVQLGGAQIDLASVTQAMSNGGTFTPSGNTHTVILTAGGGITGFTLNLPPVGLTGQTLRIYIQQTITGLTMGGTTSTGMPTNPTAGWYDCIATSTSAFICGSG
jgi:hypothetical protein